MTLRRTLALGCALAAAMAVSLGGAREASAQADLSVTATISSGEFPGVCTAPCYEVEKTVDVYNPGNGSAPAVCGAGEYTYVYSLTNLGGTVPSPGIPITEFELVVDFSLVASAGSIAGAGIDPTSNTVSPQNIVNWTFPDSSFCPTCLDEGETSDDLYICSTAAPGSSPDNVSTTAIVLDAQGECIVPTEVPAPGTAMPCTIGFWKNRYAGKNGLLKFFPDTDFDDVVAEALSLSMGVFTTADGTGCPSNFDDLLCALSSKGNRSTEQRARQQLAATLLNLAAGNLFEDNGKCQLFDLNWITSNACGDDLEVGDAVGASKTAITSPDTADDHNALECLDDINNEIGVIQSQP